MSSLIPAGRSRRTLGVLTATALACALAMSPAHADDAATKAQLEQLRATTMALIQSLVSSGLLPKDKADALIRQSQQAAETQPPAVLAVPGAAPNKSVIRVPYVPESLKAEMRDQIKQEVLAQAHNERWGEPGALPEWLRRVNLEADVRTRFQMETFDKTNFPADVVDSYLSQADAVAWSPDLANTTNDRSRMTLRARLGVSGQLGESVSAGIRLATGSDNRAASTSQTLGSNFGKYQVWLDRAEIQWQVANSLALKAGRFGNPFFGSDLSWPDDLNFDGLALRYADRATDALSPFATAGAFPLREFEVSSQDRWLYGVQVGTDWKIDAKTSAKFGLAAYDFHHIEGVSEEGDVTPSAAAQKSKPYLISEYPASVRQKGNTLMRINNYQDLSPTAAPVWGLASKFRPLVFSAALTLHQFDPATVSASFDYIKNTGFDLEDIRRRNVDNTVQLANQNKAMQFRLNVGAPRIEQKGDWQALLAWRRMERDAWVDAFTDTTWHLGGTNYSGWSMGGQYGVAPKTSVGLRWTSTRNLSPSGEPANYLSSAPLKIDVLQVELNSRF
jgi:hypothetical protein